MSELFNNPDHPMTISSEQFMGQVTIIFTIANDPDDKLLSSFYDWIVSQGLDRGRITIDFGKSTVS